MTNKAKPTAVAAYIYAGGFTLGMQDHFDVLCHLEDAKPYALETCAHNLGLDVYAWPWPLDYVADELKPDIIYANPPCCAFSSMGRAVTMGKNAWRTHPALSCTKNLVSLLKRVQPKILAWESVLNSLAHASEFIADLASEIQSLGYQFTMIPHNAYHMGSAQNRTRIMYVCSKLDLLVAEPDYNRTETVMDRLATVTDPGEEIYGEKWWNTYGHLLPLTAQGDKIRKAFMEHYAATAETNVRGHKIGCPAMSGPVRLRAERPSNVVCGFPHIHPFEDRVLWTNEMKALADFPEWWEFKCRLGGVVNEMARGVSSHVGRWLGESLAATLENNEPAEPTIQFIDLRYPAETRPSFEKYCKQRKINLGLFYPEHEQTQLPLELEPQEDLEPLAELDPNVCESSQFTCPECQQPVAQDENPCGNCGQEIVWS